MLEGNIKGFLVTGGLQRQSRKFVGPFNFDFVSFFFTIFFEDVIVSSLQKTFGHYGAVLDSFIPFIKYRLLRRFNVVWFNGIK